MAGITNRNIHAEAGIKKTQLEAYGNTIGNSPSTLGRNYYVSSTHTNAGDGGHNGRVPTDPFATIGYAVANIQDVDEVIWVAPGHVETVSVADAWKIAYAGCFIMGMGTGTRRPTITMDSITSTTILMDLAGLTFQNLRFVVGVDSLVGMVFMTAAGCRVLGCEFIMDDSSLQALVGINLSSVDADRCKIMGCDFEAVTVGGAQAIEIGKALTDLEIGGCGVFGDFSSACIHNPTSNIAVNLHIHDCRLTNTNAGEHSIELVSACTGDLIRNTYNNDMTIPTGVDPGSCRSFECFHCDVVDKSGALSPAIAT